MPFAKLGSTFHLAEVWSKKSYPTDRPTDRHPEKVHDLRGYFPQIFETEQHFSVDFTCKIEGILTPTNIFPGISLLKLKVILKKILRRLQFFSKLTNIFKGIFFVNFEANSIFLFIFRDISVPIPISYFGTLVPLGPSVIVLKGLL